MLAEFAKPRALLPPKAPGTDTKVNLDKKGGGEPDQSCDGFPLDHRLHVIFVIQLSRHARATVR